MRVAILRALLMKEMRRHLANRGGLALGALLIVAALLLSVFNPNVPGASASAPPGSTAAEGEAAGLVGGVHHCFIDDTLDNSTTRGIMAHLRKNVPPELTTRLHFRTRAAVVVNQSIQYPPGTGAIQLRGTTDAATGREKLLFDVRYPPGEPGAMVPYEQWFWKETLRALTEMATKDGVPPVEFQSPDLSDDLWIVREAYQRLDRAVNAAAQTRNPATANPLPIIEIRRKGEGGQPLHLRDAVATAMVIFALYFTCVYLLPMLTCEERERGVLLAQALSPASPEEILAAKFLFYPTLGMGLAATIGGIYRPMLLATPFFWLSLLAVAGGFLGIGMTVASLARTQRAAFLGSMCYLLSVALLLMICQQNGIPFLPNLALEYHGPRILHAAISGSYDTGTKYHLLTALILAFGWNLVAVRMFRRHGWQ